MMIYLSFISLPHLLYIDPGTGGLLIQMLLAFGLAVLLYLKKIIRWVKVLFGYKKEQIDNDEKTK
ncbi:hypothetical protein EZS27_038637 [termite gut metagenome]|jgi:hypothetical protein|uniref:Uncharacterized protein n=1 Tax=termite gut metagenome TaxID=433724 RepID=A0A5J4PK58_9ZZZZ